MGAARSEREGKLPDEVGLIVYTGRWGAWDAMVSRYSLFQRLMEWHAGGSGGQQTDDPFYSIKQNLTPSERVHDARYREVVKTLKDKKTSGEVREVVEYRGNAGVLIDDTFFSRKNILEGELDMYCPPKQPAEGEDMDIQERGKEGGGGLFPPLNLNPRGTGCGGRGRASLLPIPAIDRDPRTPRPPRGGGWGGHGESSTGGDVGGRGGGAPKTRWPHNKGRGGGRGGHSLAGNGKESGKGPFYFDKNGKKIYGYVPRPSIILPLPTSNKHQYNFKYTPKPLSSRPSRR